MESTWLDVYVPDEWMFQTNTIGYALWCATNTPPDVYHFDTYGEHVNEWDIIL